VSDQPLCFVDAVICSLPTSKGCDMLLPTCKLLSLCKLAFWRIFCSVAKFGVIRYYCDLQESGSLQA
jgi:hypothetical protein